MSDRDLLREFVQWLVDNPSARRDLVDALEDDDPDVAEAVVDAFLGPDPDR